jgi:hypothetical protein
MLGNQKVKVFRGKKEALLLHIFAHMQGLSLLGAAGMCVHSWEGSKHISKGVITSFYKIAFFLFFVLLRLELRA